MNTIRTFAIASTVLTGLLAATLPALAQDAYEADCGISPMHQVSALVWDAGSETFVAHVVDIMPARVAPARYTAAPAAPGPDANLLLDESLMGAGRPGLPVTLSFDPGS